MKKELFITIFILTLIISGCSNKKNKPLAKNFSEQSKLEAEQNNFKQALQLVNKSIEIEETPESIAYKATLLHQLKDFKESCSLCKKVINNKNASVTLKADTMNNYACSLLALGKENKAKEIWLQLITNKNYLSPEVALMNLGCLELTNAVKNQFDNKVFTQYIITANNFLNQAVEIAPEYVDACYYLSITDIYLNNLNKAQTRLEEIILFVPEHKLAQSLLKQVNEKIRESYKERYGKEEK